MDPTLMCKNCGGQLTLKKGQHITVTHWVTLGPDNEVVDQGSRDGWCGDCIEEWDERTGLNGLGVLPRY